MAFKRPYSANEKDTHKRPSNSSTMKFIPFTQSSTRHDGTRSEATNPYQSFKEEKCKAPNIDVMSMINPRELQEKRRWMEKLRNNVKNRMNSDKGTGKSLTDNLSHCIQVTLLSLQ